MSPDSDGQDPNDAVLMNIIGLTGRHLIINGYPVTFAANFLGIIGPDL